MTEPARTPRNAHWQPAEIARIEPRTPRISSFFLRTALPRPLAGQHLDVRLTAPDGYQAQRSYSIASAPGTELAELLIEKLDDGEVSPYFHEAAQPGDTIEVRGPIGGHFVWRAADGGPLLLVAGGSGIAPLLAIVRERAVTAPHVPALLVYSARTWEDLAWRDELFGFGADTDAFTAVALTTRGASPRPQDHARRLDGALLQALLAQWGHEPRHVYACGSNVFVEAATSALVAQGLEPGRIRTERYGGAG